MIFTPRICCWLYTNEHVILMSNFLFCICLFISRIERIADRTRQSAWISIIKTTTMTEGFKSLIVLKYTHRKKSSLRKKKKKKCLLITGFDCSTFSRPTCQQPHTVWIDGDDIRIWSVTTINRPECSVLSRRPLGDLPLLIQHTSLLC